MAAEMRGLKPSWFGVIHLGENNYMSTAAKTSQLSLALRLVCKLA